MRKTVIALALFALAGCGSQEPEPAETEQGLSDVVEDVAQPPDPMGSASEAPLPEATGGGAAVR